MTPEQVRHARDLLTPSPPRERGALLYPPRWWPTRPIPVGPPRNWQHGLGAYVAGRYAAARVNIDAAHILLRLLTRGCRTLDCFQEQRI
ncbi:hypothetical protein [Nocardia salmonicida]|uniref:hypothetical protein n=1 Tax=Nocardia salmonicida TaxID=53431 RepID=UPI000B31AD09|nr:hypothetical protein [Nocardia salmonicida]